MLRRLKIEIISTQVVEVVVVAVAVVVVVVVVVVAVVAAAAVRLLARAGSFAHVVSKSLYYFINSLYTIKSVPSARIHTHSRQEGEKGCTQKLARANNSWRERVDSGSHY